MNDCPSCQSPNPEAARFCGSCGVTLGGDTPCPSCGTPNPVEGAFCHSCGTGLRSAEPASSQAESAKFSSLANGRYRVQRFLGQGARKEVFLARDAELNREVAIALIKEDGLGEEGLARVRREVQAMGELGDHPHIVTVHDIGEEAGRLYIISQYLAGGSLDDRITRSENGRLPMDEVLRLGGEICEGLAHAHARGIIHRDLKPGNIWLTESGTAHLGDFGLALSLEQTRLSQEGLIVGTVAYMPPEQALGRGAEARSDLYSLGAMLYEALTGRPPFPGDGVVSIISQHINTPPVAPSALNPEIPASLERLILALLEKDPERRPASAAEVREILSELRGRSSASEVAAMPCNPLDRLSSGVFVGRDREVASLRSGLEQALAGRGRILLLVGEPGIGKTRTSEELVTVARVRGAQVIWGRCYEGEGAPAYWPWAQILRASLKDREPDSLKSWIGSGAADIAEVIPEVRSLFPNLDPLPQLEPDAARFRLFDAITSYLKNLAGSQALVLVLDDLHWADESSLLLLQFLVREIRETPLLVLGTYRDVELKRGHPLRETLAVLTREGLSERILLRGLKRADVARFLEMAMCGRTSPELADAIYDETEGNPFFVQEVVRLLATDGRLEDLDDPTARAIAIPEGVRDVIGRRLSQLSELCNELLTMGSVIGREFDLTLLERVSGEPSERLLEAIEEAMASRVLVEIKDSVGGYRFSHALVRETLYEELSTPRRVRLHRKIAEMIEGMRGDAPESRLPELAHHFFQSIQAGSVDKAVDYSVEAAEWALRQLAYQEAVAHYDHALQASEFQEPVDDRRRCELLLAKGEATRRAGAHGLGRETFNRAAALARELGLVDEFVQAAIGYARLLIFGAPDPTALGLLREALEQLGPQDSAVRARLLGLQGMVLRWDEGRERAWELATQAVEMARRVNDLPTLAHALDVLHMMSDPFLPPADRMAVPHELLRVAETIGDNDLLFAGGVHLIVDLLEDGDLAGVVAQLEALEAVVAVLRQPIREATVKRMRAGIELLTGRLPEADTLLNETRALAVRIDSGFVRRFDTLQTAFLSFYLGEYQAGISAVQELIAKEPDSRLGVILTFLLAEAGRDQEARVALVAANRELDTITNYWSFLSICLISRASVLLGDVRLAESLYERLVPFAERSASMLFLLSMGSNHGFLGPLATLLGRWDEAEQHFEAASAANTAQGARTALAVGQYDRAQLCLARNAPGDRDRALELVNSSLELAREIGMKGLVEKGLAVKLALHGIHPGQDVRASLEVVTSSVESRAPDLSRHAAADGTVTLMFSDMEGFTSMTERLGDEAALEVIRRHNSIVRKALAAHGGYEVELQGDGFLLAFSRAVQALECAIAIQRSFESYSREHADQPIRVRIGLHSGEAIQDANKFFGKAVILASRIADQAQSTEILVSQALRERVDGKSSFEFDPGRELELKGLSGRHQVYTVNWS